ncbi:hypothetical protein ACFX1Z_046707 [Malus domestica]
MELGSGLPSLNNYGDYEIRETLVFSFFGSFLCSLESPLCSRSPAIISPRSQKESRGFTAELGWLNRIGKSGEGRGVSRGGIGHVASGLGYQDGVWVGLTVGHMGDGGDALRTHEDYKDLDHLRKKLVPCRFELHVSNPCT